VPDENPNVAAPRQLSVTNSRGFDPTSGDNPVDSVDNAVTQRPALPGKPDISDSEASRPGVDGNFQQSANTDSNGLRGPDLARAALRAAREAAGTKGRRDGSRRQAPRSGSRQRRRWSGAGADDRDPQPIGKVAARLAAERNWTSRLSGGRVFGAWAALVGADVAEHAKPVSLRDGELIVQASSTAWATQLRLLQRQLLAKIAKGVGNGVVTRLKVQGPATPSWRYGPRHVSGRGPRDTYG
jgi:predicted nucleic acid-binding Zn ribbon protein